MYRERLQYILSLIGVFILVGSIGCGPKDEPQPEDEAAVTEQAAEKELSRKTFGRFTRIPDSRIVYLPAANTPRSIPGNTLLRMDLSQRTLKVKAGSYSNPVWIRIRPYERAENKLVWGESPLKMSVHTSGGLQTSLIEPIVFNELAGTDQAVEFPIYFKAPNVRSDITPSIRIVIHYDVVQRAGTSSGDSMQVAVVEFDVLIPVERGHTTDPGDVEIASTVRTPVVKDSVRLPVRVNFERKVLALRPVFGGSSGSGAAFGHGFGSDRIPQDIDTSNHPVDTNEKDEKTGW